MSSDPTQPEPNQEKNTPKPSKKAKEATEHDLWDLDFDDTPAAADSPAESGRLPARRPNSTPSVRSKKPAERPIEVPVVGDARKATEEPAKGKASNGENPVKPAEEKRESAPAPKESIKAGTKPGKEQKSWDESDDEKPEAAAPVSETGSARSFVSSLSKIEKIAISGLLAALVVAATFTFVHFSNRVPTRSPLSEKIDFPVSGKLIEITAAATYWREPVTSGEKADVVRRGTKLIPVLKITMKAKPCAVRIFFRNEEGIVVGDGITRIVSGDTELTIPATAGFDDIGMHAAYRTGESIPWVVQIYEGPNRGASREKFDKVLETEISTDIR